MKKYVQMVLVLGVVGLISGVSLVFIYRYATPLIEDNQKKELKEAIFKVVPGGARYEELSKDKQDIFKVYDDRGKLLGYAFKAEGSGYQGKIKMIAGINKDAATLYGVEILESVETPGLGGEIVGAKFKDQFRNLNVISGIICVKKEREKDNEIQAVTGATISSNSVTSILNKRISELKDILKK